MKNLIRVLAMFSVAASMSVQAQTVDGTLGATSDGDVEVTITMPGLVRVYFPNSDLNLTYADDSTDETTTEEFCIYSNQGTVDIDIDIDPQNVPSSGTLPVLTNGTDQVAYDLDLQLQGGGAVAGGANLLAAATNIANHASAAQDDTTCTGGNSHQFVVTVSETALEAASAGAYADTVDVVVTAN